MADGWLCDYMTIRLGDRSLLELVEYVSLQSLGQLTSLHPSTYQVKVAAMYLHVLDQRSVDAVDFIGGIVLLRVRQM